MTGEADLIVIGSGAAGLATAVTAAALELSVVVLESADTLGGTTAWSGGWIWAPGNPVARRHGASEDPADPRRYLEAVLGNRFDPARIDAFLAVAPEMVSFFEECTALEFEAGLAIPDTYGQLPGAGTGGRSLIARPHDARGLGAALGLLRCPARETTFFGMTIQAGADLRAFLTMTRSPRAFAHATRRRLRHIRGLALHGRGMDLRNGSGLAARLMRSALDLSVALRTGAGVAELTEEDGRAAGVRLTTGEVIRARRGIVLATGGYPHDPSRRAATFPRDAQHRTLAVPSATGGGIRLAERIGARFVADVRRPAALCPVSAVPWPDGSIGHFPHIIDRGKPGVIGVLADGRRFCNEGLGYHDYVEALLDAVPEEQPARAWLVCDHRFLRRYGLGIVRPRPAPWRHWARRGYLRTGRTVPDLARAGGIDVAGLTRAVAEWNEGARHGRGTTPYMRLQGDPEVQPNPCVAPIERAPFCAVEVVPGSFGTFAGLARVASISAPR